MYQWHRQIQHIVDEIDRCIQRQENESATLQRLAQKLGYSQYHTTRKFKEIAGMTLRDYLRQRKLAFALQAVRDSGKGLLDIALSYGFSSHEAFTRAFQAAYGITPAPTANRLPPWCCAPKSTPLTATFSELEKSA